MIDSPVDPAASGFQHPGMTEISTILQSSIIVLLLLILVALVRIGTKIGRLEKRLSPLDSSSIEKESVPEVSYEGAFGKFVSERPELLTLKKGEQFAAFRAWRKEQGLNWEGKSD
jgi:hypothetical protein